METARDSDLPGLVGFLRGHEAGSMFPLARLSATGLGGEGPHALEAWLARRAGKIAGMVGLTAAGMLLPQWPEGDWTKARLALAGRKLTGMVGPRAQVRAILPAFGLEGEPTRHDSDEAGFTLALRDLVLPPGPGGLVRPTHADLPLMQAWRAAYLQELFATPPDEAQAKAEGDVALWLRADSHRLLVLDGLPVAMCGFNARLPEVVQVGGVFVPVALRGKGFARTVVARHLAEARTAGAVRAVLFAVSAAAVRAYRAIGFRDGEAMSLVLLEGAAEVQAWR